MGQIPRHFVRYSYYEDGAQVTKSTFIYAMDAEELPDLIKEKENGKEVFLELTSRY